MEVKDKFSSFFSQESKSISFLKKRIQLIFKRELGISPLFLGAKNFAWPSNLEEPQDIILMGDALLLLLNPYIWPASGKFRLWVISQSHQKLISSITGLPIEYISVIPRYLIIKENKNISPWPDFTQVATLVLSTRYTDDKNIDFSLKLASQFQKQTQGKIKLAIFSPSENKEHFIRAINKLDWITRPKFYGDCGLNWHKKKSFKKPILLNFSTSFFEDFSVVVAQARELGWPVILSHWAVFRELNRESVLYVPSKTILNKPDLKIINALVKDLKKQMLKEISLIPDKSTILLKPNIISAKKIIEIQKKFSQKERTEIFNTFTKSHPGRYHKKIQDIFS